MKKFYLLLTLFVITAIQMANAQAPQGIPYQAVARNNAGNLIKNQPISLRFSIHDGSTGGTVVYSETHSVTTDALGLFSVNIGGGTSSSTLADVSWGSGAKFTQVELDVTGGSNFVDMGTTQMMSVPYALYAASGGTALPSGSLNQTLRYNGANWVADGNIINDGTGVYIGNSIYDRSLIKLGQFYGNVTFGANNQVTSGQNNVAGGFNSVASGDNSFAFGYGATATGVNTIAIGKLATATGQSSTAMGGIVNTNGKDGSFMIGDVSTESYLNATNNNQFSSRFDGGYRFYSDNNTTEAKGMFINGANVFGTNGQTSNAGYVGIGTATPNEKLDVVGNVKANSFVKTGGTSSQYLMANGSTSVGPDLSGYATTDALNNTSSLLSAQIADENVRATNAEYALSNQISNVQSNFVTTAANANNISNVNAGNVGIGTNAPTEKLDVVGNVKVSGTINNITIGMGGSNSVDNTTAIGNGALTSNVSGSFNTATGFNAMGNNTSGSINTANGEFALYSNVGGNSNTAIGNGALYSNISGSSNSATARGALSNNTTGEDNTANGNWSLYSNITGNQNTALGNSSDVESGNLNNATALGFGAIVNASNKIQLGNISVTSVNTSGTYTGAGFVKAGGTSSQYLMADGTTTIGPDLSGYATTASVADLADNVAMNYATNTSLNNLAVLPSGSLNQTLRYNGANWVADGNIINDGTSVYIGNSIYDRSLIKLGQFYGNVTFGANNQVTSGQNNVAGGFNSVASGDNSFAFGYGATATGVNTIAIGKLATATGQSSTAMGGIVNTNGKDGSFMIGDVSTESYLNATNNNQFSSRFDGGYRFYSDYNTTEANGLFINGTNGQTSNAGNVGIGTATPTEKLYVVGNVKANSFVKTGGTSSQYLMADGSTSAGTVATTMGPIGASSTANGGTITSGVLSLTPADTANAGIVTKESQSFAGNKTIADKLGVGTTNITTSAKMEVNSTTQGFLPPRMSTGQRDAIVSPVAGLTIWCSNAKELEVYDGSRWTNMIGGTTAADNTPRVLIGAKTWTTQNLNVSTYRDGTSIPRVDNATTWAGLTTGAYCYFNNDSATYAAVYGKLYNWYAVAGIYDASSLSNASLRKNLAPAGYHIPTDAEWSTLTTTLGANPGTQMKSTSTWTSGGTGNGTNTSGFTGLPGGNRSFNGLTFGGLNGTGYWWSSTEISSTNAWYRALVGTLTSVDRYDVSKAYGMSVRCLLD